MRDRGKYIKTNKPNKKSASVNYDLNNLNKCKKVTNARKNVNNFFNMYINDIKKVHIENNIDNNINKKAYKKKS